MKPKLNNQPQVFLMKSGNKDVGYVTFEEAEAIQIGRKGVQEVVHSRIVQPDRGAALWR